MPVGEGFVRSRLGVRVALAAPAGLLLGLAQDDGRPRMISLLALAAWAGWLLTRRTGLSRGLPGIGGRLLQIEPR